MRCRYTADFYSNAPALAGKKANTTLADFVKQSAVKMYQSLIDQRVDRLPARCIRK